MVLGAAARRRIGFIADWAKSDQDDPHFKEMDDLSCSMTVFCSFVVMILTPLYYREFLKHRKLNFFPHGRKFLDQICFMLLCPSIFCTLNVICFLIESIAIPQLSIPYVTDFIYFVQDIVTATIETLTHINKASFVYFLIFFSSSTRFFVMYLAMQRFIIIFLPKKFQFLLNPSFLRFYIAIAWILSSFYKIIAFAAVFYLQTRDPPERMLKQYNFVNSLSFASLALASIIYIAIFIHFCKIPRQERWNRPEIALLYEGIPLLIVNVFIFNFLIIDLNSRELVGFRYFTYEMRSSVITTALVQFTYVFSFQKLVNYYNYLKGVEMKVFITGASISPILPLANETTIRP